MFEWLKQLGYALSLQFKSRARLEAENLVLRHQVNVLIRKLPKRLQLTNSDRLRLVWLYRLFPSILDAIRVVRPETVIRWHRRSFDDVENGILAQAEAMTYFPLRLAFTDQFQYARCVAIGLDALTGRRPNTTPRLRAAAMPERTRSRNRSRSNSARAAMKRGD
jgi:hypothetical protein